MHRVLGRPETTRPDEPDAAEARIDSNVEGFLTELGELSRRHGLAIGDGASLYVMEPEDYARSYLTDEESALTFA